MEIAILFIRSGIGLSMILFGLNQVKYPQMWLHYIPDFLHDILQSTTKEEQIMRIHASGNVILGSLLLSGFIPLLAAWFALLWWILVAPFGFMKKWDIGVRDTGIISALAGLICLLL